MAYSLEERARARSMFVETGLSYEQVAQETGISISQLKEWGRDQEWTRERDEYERDYLQLSGGLQKLKVQLLKDAVASGHPQKIYALANLLKATTSPKAAVRSEDRATLFLEWAGKLIDYLKQADTEALRHLEPHLRGFADSVKQPEAA